jgi:hypothetical protein
MPLMEITANVRGAAADVDHHVSQRLFDWQARADRRHGLLHEIHFAGPGAVRGVLHRPLFHRRDFARHPDDDARTHQQVPVVRFLDEYVSIFSVTLKSAITPSFIGLMTTAFLGVRPSISFASRPTATTWPLALLIATIDGSFTTMPLPCENTSVFEVPRTMARSEENQLNTNLML